MAQVGRAGMIGRVGLVGRAGMIGQAGLIGRSRPGCRRGLSIALRYDASWFVGLGGGDVAWWAPVPALR